MIWGSIIERPRLAEGGPLPELLAAAREKPAAIELARFGGLPGFIPDGPERVHRVSPVCITYVQDGWGITPRFRGGVFAGWLRRRGRITHHVALCMSYRARLLQAIAASSSGGATVNPAELGSATLYLQADLGHSEPDGDPMATGWANQVSGGSALDISQGTASLQPTYDAALTAFNEQPVITFDGGDVMYCAATAAWEQSADGDDMSAYVVIQNTSAANTQGAYLQTRQYNSQGGMQCTSNCGGSPRTYVYDENANSSITQTRTSDTQNTVHVVAWALTGAVTPGSDSLTTYRDGSSVAGPGTQDLVPGVEAGSNRELLVGGGNTTTGNLTASIGELWLASQAIPSSGDQTSLSDRVDSRYSVSTGGIWA